MRNLKTFFAVVCMFLLSQPASAQVEMADAMRANGKIYVVVAMIVIILAGLFFYLFILDKKIKKLENLLRDKKPN